MAAQSNKQSSITTGGGTSRRFSLPTWQESYVNSYFTQVQGTDKSPVSGYSTNTRGYPDVSLLAHSYAVVVGGNLVGVDGTSASCPVMAGMVALVNAGRRARGNSTVGWLNPALYTLSKEFIVDILVGNNKCLVSDVPCCTQGFHATTGWDPVTGLGVVNFKKFFKAFVGVEASSSTTVEDDDLENVNVDDDDGNGSNASNSKSSNDNTSTLTSGAIAGIVIGCIAGCILLMAGVIYYFTCSAASTTSGSKAAAATTTTMSTSTTGSKTTAMVDTTKGYKKAASAPPLPHTITRQSDMV